MGAARRLAHTEAYLETGIIERVESIERVEGIEGAHGPESATTTATTSTTTTRPAPAEGQLRVRLATGTLPATRAKSCLVAPEAGDKVLCSIDAEGVTVVAVLVGSNHGSTTLSAQGDLRLEARGGRVSVCGARGVDVATAGAVGLAGAEVHVRAQRGTVAVQELGFFGRLVQAEVARVAVLADQIDSVVNRLSSRAKRVFRFIEEVDQTRAGTVDVRAQGMLGLRSENAVISARVLAKVDGEQIHIG